MVLLDVGFEGASIAIFHDEVEVMLGRNLHFYAVHEIFMFGNLLQNLYLGHDRFFIFRHDRDDFRHQLA